MTEDQRFTKARNAGILVGIIVLVAGWFIANWIWPPPSPNPNGEYPSTGGRALLAIPIMMIAGVCGTLVRTALLRRTLEPNE